jgi:hypothetical protein
VDPAGLVEPAGDEAGVDDAPCVVAGADVCGVLTGADVDGGAALEWVALRVAGDDVAGADECVAVCDTDDDADEDPRPRDAAAFEAGELEWCREPEAECSAAAEVESPAAGACDGDFESLPVSRKIPRVVAMIRTLSAAATRMPLGRCRPAGSALPGSA